MSAPRTPGRDGEEHRSWDELAVGWSLHALEPEDESRFLDHLAGCDRCAGTVADTAGTMAELASDLPQAEPSEALRERLRAAVERTEQLPPAERPARRPAEPDAPPAAPPADGPAAVRRPEPARSGASRFGNLSAPLPSRVADPRPSWRRRLPAALVAAAVAAVLALGAWNATVSSDRDQARAEAAERQEMLDALLVPGRATIAPLEHDGRSVGTVVARDGQVQVVTDGFDVNDRDDSVYVVWGITDVGPEAIGTFDVVSPQMDLRTVGSDATGLDDYSTYGISLEPGRQAPSAPTDIVAIGQVTS